VGYLLEGKIFEACSCGGPCPCWAGDDPKGGSCDSMNVYHYDRGSINGIDVSGLTLALVNDIQGNIMDGQWTVVAYVDSKATPDQKAAILAAHGGQLGGPLADLAKLVASVQGVYDVPIQFDVAAGKATVRINAAISAELQLEGATRGWPTEQTESLFCTVPKSASVGEALDYRANIPQHNMQWEYSGRNATLGDFRFEEASTDRKG
jgi:hypothetical protein